MRKLIILKSLVDFIWIVSCIPLIGLSLFFLVYMFINPNSIDLVFEGITKDSETPNYTKQLFGIVYIGIGLISIYCLFIFRKTLRYFQQVKPFHTNVINNFYKIGYLLIIVGTAGTVVTFISRLLFKEEFKISFGLTPHFILICLGLFFMVLSEVFKVAKYAKEENDLTI
ncbi:DUF2975 domain-containing protein [Winogradskyella sp.]|uniref:DUF2975 domain-containing protein n=1 Tax=Winogradskyella sp. TaxID=1883156 RepID=UPI002608B979|nr:DUF2975 domain-containing protein [Winogradskyella sp.]